jgi:RND family efflux transporter MFP subunit
MILRILLEEAAMFRMYKKWWIALVVLILIAGGAGYYLYGRNSLAASTQKATPIQTSLVRTGDLVISATGTGTTVAYAQSDLGFGEGAVLTEVNVQIGDKVKAGDVLARIDDLNARKAVASAQLQVTQAQSDLDTARQNYKELLKGASNTELLAAQAALATAEEKVAQLQPSEGDLAAAEAALASAQEAYKRLINGPDAEEIARAELNLSKAKNSLWGTQANRDATGGQVGAGKATSSQYEAAQSSVANAEIAVQLAQMDLEDLKKPATEAELKDAKAAVAQAQEKLDELRAGGNQSEKAAAEAGLAQAKATLDELRARPTAEDASSAEAQVQQAELNLAQAKLVLEAAQRELEQTILTAPIDGTVMDVTAKAGETVGGSAFITLADMSKPMVEIYLDETDIDKVVPGYEVEVKFDAMPDETFKGHVTRVDPQLVTVSNSLVVHGLVTLDADSFAKPQQLLLGLNASVDVIGGRATNAVLVPVEALRELDPGEYAVFVVKDGKSELRTVEVGLQDYTYAEIRSGLQPGEIVSTGLVETK